LNSSYEIFAGQINVEFDSSLVEFVSIVKGDYLGSGAQDSNDLLSLGGQSVVVSSGEIRKFFVIKNLSGSDDGIAGEGVFATITFKGLAEGVSDIRITDTVWGNSTAGQIIDPNEEINDGQIIVSSCGDGICAVGENCNEPSYCNADCGGCGGGNNPGGGNDNDDGGSPGGGTPPSDDDGSTLKDFLNFLIGGGDDDDSGNETCSEDWQCSDWSVCVSGEKTRDCVDANGCSEDRVESKTCGDANNGGVVVAGVISIASFIGLVVFVVLYYRTKHHVSVKKEAVIQGAEKMRAQWK
jgi:hypothetical protein